MKAEIIAIGTEITNGAKLDTNSQWLSNALSALGIHVEFHTSVADTMESIVGVIRTAFRRAELVLITGGLGPTLDDLTRQAIAEILHVSLLEDRDALAHIEQMFAKRGREMPERNRIQAKFPSGTEPLDNPIGTAPGIWCEIPRLDKEHHCCIASMPGVPVEMKKMFREQVVPRLPTVDSKKIIKRARVNAFGVGESDAEERLGDLTARGRNPEVGITVHQATITLRINAVGETAEECDRMISEAKVEARERLGNLIFGEEDDELEHVLLRELVKKSKTLSTVETGTGGLLADRLTDVLEHRETYKGGLVIPGGNQDFSLLDLDEEWLIVHGTVSKQSAVEMATRCRAKFGTDFALAVTEYPQAAPDSEEIPVAWIAAVGEDFRLAISQHQLGDASFRKSRAAKAAMNLLRLQLQKG